MKSRNTSRLAAAPRAVLDAALAGIGVATAGAMLGAYSDWLDLFSHFHLQLAAIAALLALVMLGARHWGRVAIAALLGLANAAPVGPFLHGNPAHAGSGDGTIKLIALNVLHHNDERGRVLEFLRNEAADVVVLSEVSSSWRADLAGLAADYPHAVECGGGFPCDVMLLSRIPFDEAEARYVEAARLPLVRARFGEITVFGTHLIAPLPPYGRRVQSRQIEALSGIIGATAGAVVLAGDLNATPWSRAFAALAGNTGLRHHGPALPSWPATPAFVRIPIDHVLAGDGVEVVSLRTGREVGSDHLPLIAELALTPAAARAR